MEEQGEGKRVLETKFREKEQKWGQERLGGNALRCNPCFSLSFRHISLGYCEFSDR